MTRIKQTIPEEMDVIEISRGFFLANGLGCYIGMTDETIEHFFEIFSLNIDHIDEEKLENGDEIHAEKMVDLILNLIKDEYRELYSEEKIITNYIIAQSELFEKSMLLDDTMSVVKIHVKDEEIICQNLDKDGKDRIFKYEDISELYPHLIIFNDNSKLLINGEQAKDSLLEYLQTLKDDDDEE